MCGISGFIGRTKEDRDREAILKNMMDKIIHRGPDQEGMYVNDQVALGFRRLSIIDLDHGMQPMFNETGDIVIVFNGEIYNHLELREDLIAKGPLSRGRGGLFASNNVAALAALAVGEPGAVIGDAVFVIVVPDRRLDRFLRQHAAMQLVRGQAAERVDHLTVRHRQRFVHRLALDHFRRHRA